MSALKTTTLAAVVKGDGAVTNDRPRSFLDGLGARRFPAASFPLIITVKVSGPLVDKSDHEQ